LTDRVGRSVADKRRKAIVGVNQSGGRHAWKSIVGVRRAVRVGVRERARHLNSGRVSIRRSRIITLLGIQAGTTRRVLSGGVRSTRTRSLVVWARGGRGRLRDTSTAHHRERWNASERGWGRGTIGLTRDGTVSNGVAARVGRVRASSGVAVSVGCRRRGLPTSIIVVLLRSGLLRRVHVCGWSRRTRNGGKRGRGEGERRGRGGRRRRRHGVRRRRVLIECQQMKARKDE
jgi:hypothetical protein